MEPGHWPYLRALTGHTREVRVVAFSPDGSARHRQRRPDGAVVGHATGPQRDPHRPQMARLGGWRSAQTAPCWPPPAKTGRPGCGTGHRARHPARSPGHRRGQQGWRSARTATAARHRQHRQDRAAVGPGHRPAARATLTGHTARSWAWRSARTAGCSPPPAATGRRGCGTDLGPVGVGNRALPLHRRAPRRHTTPARSQRRKTAGKTKSPSPGETVEVDGVVAPGSRCAAPSGSLRTAVLRSRAATGPATTPCPRSVPR